MAEIGKINTLEVMRETDNGFYLDGQNLGEILMPRKFITDEVRSQGWADVFVYTDSEDRLVATTETPLVKVGEFAFLNVVAVTRFGAFLDWGLPKNLLVPFSEQRAKMVEGRNYLVYVYIDLQTNRIAASAKINKYLDNTPPLYKHGEEVQLLVAEETELGFKAIVNSEHWGILYHDQLFQRIEPGQQLTGFVNKVRDDDKIDLLLEKPGYEKVDAISQKILDELKQNRDFMAVSDNTSPEMIKALFGISKKSFKKAIGSLYKNQRITFTSDGIRLLN